MPSTIPAATGSRFLHQASPIDFCNLTRNPGTPRTRAPHAIRRFHACPLPTTGRAVSAVSDTTPWLQHVVKRLVALADASRAPAVPAEDVEPALRSATQEANSLVFWTPPCRAPTRLLGPKKFKTHSTYRSTKGSPYAVRANGAAHVRTEVPSSTRESSSGSQPRGIGCFHRHPSRERPLKFHLTPFSPGPSGDLDGPSRRTRRRP